AVSTCKCVPTGMPGISSSSEMCLQISLPSQEVPNHKRLLPSQFCGYPIGAFTEMSSTQLSAAAFSGRSSTKTIRVGGCNVGEKRRCGGVSAARKEHNRNTRREGDEQTREEKNGRALQRNK
ncbi:hypothetical protein TcCL_NonESM06800, partial [Trypanosoma cruzi]